MEVTKCLKPLLTGRDLVTCECAGRNVSERLAVLEQDDVPGDPVPLPGKADMDR
jgi:hypothetical protein